MEVYAGWENWQILEHLLGPLSPEEVSRASKLVRIHLQRSSSIPQNLLFVSVTLREPEKPLVLQHINGTYKGPRVQRKAEIVGLSRTECMAFEATVRLADRCIPGNAGIWKTKPPSASNSFIHPNQLPTSPLSPSAVMASVDCGEYDMMDEMDDQNGSIRREELDVLEEFTWKKDVQPALTPTEYLEVERVIKTHPDIIRVLAERYSIFDIEKEVHVDAWSAGRGYKGEEQDDTTSIRFCKPLLFHCPPLSEGLSPHDINLYSRPIHGITLVVDLMTMKLLRIDQYDVHRKSFPDAITTYWEKPNLKSRRTPPPPPPPFPVSSPSTATCEVNNTCCANQIPQQSLLFNNQNAESCCKASQSQLPFPPPSAPYSSSTSTATTNDSEVNFNPLASLKPLEILQPQGPTFQIKGHLIEWSNWAIRIGFTPREGLVLHQVSYADPDSGRPRSILYRASLAELVVPYGDPTVPNYRKNAFDVGEEGVGINVNSLVLGCDCLGEIYYFDVTLPYCDGSSKVVKNAICLHEEDHGLLWKHTDWRSGHVWSTRSRRLVVSSFCTIANYDYGFFWYFYLDGRIEYEVKLTGILNVDSMDPQSLQEKGVPDYAVLLDNGLYAPVHQHFFGMRLDMMIEGERNWLYEVDAQSDPPDPQTNPQGNSFRIKRRLLSCEEEAQRLLNSESARYWLVTNNQRLNRWRQPVGYRLSPGHNARVLMQPQAPIMRRARFLERHLWATQFSPLERFPAGEYPNQSAGGSGLPWWTYANRPLAGQDLVLWYNFGITHVPRPEEWPIMPICCVGFELIPDNFFDRNPTMMGRQPEKFQSATSPGTVSAARTYSIPAHIPTPPSSSTSASGHHSSETSVHNNTSTTSCCKKLTARL